MTNDKIQMRYYGWVILLIAVTLLPYMAWTSHRFQLVHVLALMSVYMLLALGVSQVIGQTGLLDLGYMAFYAISCYTAMLLSVRGAAFWLSMPVCLLVTALFRFLLGAPILRLRGDYLAIVTLGFGEITRIVLNNWDPLTNGPKGLPRVGETLTPVRLGSFIFTNDIHFYYLTLFFLFLTFFCMRRLSYSRIGRAFLAIREDEVAASLSGINVHRTKLLSFVLSSFPAAFAGCIYTHWIGFISPESFTFWESVLLVTMVVLGGSGNIWGPLFGACLIVGLPELLRADFARKALGIDLTDYRMLLFGVILLAVVILRPQGILPARR